MALSQVRKTFSDPRADQQRESTSSVSTDKVVQVYDQLTPLTAPFKNKAGQKIQLWRSDHYGLIGAVLSDNGNLQVIPGHKICNPCNSQEPPAVLAERLENSPVKAWDIAFDTHSLVLTIWPHLVAAGKGGEYRDIRSKGSPVRYLPEAVLIEKLKEKGFAVKKGDPNVWINPKRGVSVHLDRKGEGPNPHKPTHIDVKFTPERQREHREFRQQRNAEQKRQFQEQRTDINRKVTEGQLSSREGKKQLYALDKRQETRERAQEAYARLKPKWLFSYGEKRPPDQGGSQQKPSGGNTPGGKDFKQLLQQTRLTESYNATHRNNPVPAKGSVGGEIGGVACSMEYIEGLFDAPEAFFEMDHFFCLPKLPDGGLPFSEGELRQILRELAIGVYVDSTIPFFSLHFRQGSADLFPVIHPAYENTLVGRVIGLLDYFMKGYLNGGIFTEEFIEGWHNDSNWERKAGSALENLTDLMAYCQTRLEGEDKQYVSLRMMEQGMFSGGLLEQLGRALSDEPPALKEFEGFRNSFRIIAKQNSFQKSGNVFVIDTDFDVFSTIEPSPEYKEELVKYQRTHGTLPPSYQTMVEMYGEMEKRIHDHMVKMPMCRDYFAMLGVINFFSSYFSTLKKQRKIPVLPPFERVESKGCPPLFPHIPLLKTSKEPLRVNLQEVVRDFITSKREGINVVVSRFIDSGFTSTEVPFLTGYEKDLSPLIEKSILSHSSPPFKRFLQKNRDTQEQKTVFEEVSGQILKAINKQFSDLITQYYSIPSERRVSKQKAFSFFLDKIHEMFPNETTELTSEISFSAMFTHAELSPKEIDRNSRVVGGCGMQLEKQAVQPSKRADSVLQQDWEKLQALKPESWTSVDMGDLQGDAFRLILEDVPAWVSEDYSWMEFLLLFPKGEANPEAVEKTAAILEAMSQGSHENFSSAIDSVSDLHKIHDLHGASLLSYAARIEDPFYTQTLLAKGLSPDEPDAQGYLPVHYAAMQGAIEPLSLLLAASAGSINAVSHNGSSPLIVAIQNNQEAAVRALLAKNPRPSLLASGYTDLHCALHEGNPEIIAAIVAIDALTRPNINVCSEEGGTPLMLASELDNPELVQALIDKGASAAAKRADGVTPIEIAIVRGCVPVLEVLLRKASPSSAAVEAALRDSSVEVVQLVVNKLGERFSSFKNGCEDTPAHIAMRSANIPVALFLAERFSHQFTAPNIEETTALHLALRMGVWAVVEKLYEKGVVPEVEPLLRAPYHPLVKKILQAKSFTPEQLQEALLIALQAGNYLAITQALQPLGAKLDGIKNPNGLHALHFLAKADAIFLFRKEVFKAKDPLLRLEADGNKTLPYIAAEHESSRVFAFLLNEMKRGDCPLNNHFKDRHLFCAVIDSANLQNVKKMLEVFPDQNLQSISLDADQTRPIHLAAQVGASEIVASLLDSGAEINVEDSHRRTALYYAVRSGDEKTVSLLLSRGAQINARDLFLAVSQKDDSVLKLLVEKGLSQPVLDHSLYLSVRRRNFSAFKQLCGLGAGFDHVTPKRWTPLLLASWTGQGEVLEVILNNTGGGLDDRKLDGNNALHLACTKGHAHCALLLLGKGYSATAPNEQEKTPAVLAQNNTYVLQILNNETKPYSLCVERFVQALREDDPRKMDLFFSNLPPSQTLSITYENQQIWGTPLLLLARFSKGKKIQDSLVKLLNGLKSWPVDKDSEGNSLAHLLVKCGLSPLDFPHLPLGGRNNEGQSVLHIAAEGENTTLLSALAVALSPAEINEEDLLGQTPVFHALRAKNEDNAQVLLSRGADLNHYDHRRLTPLFLACVADSLATVKLFLREGADPNQVGTSHRVPPIVLAISKKNTELVRCLLFGGAKLDRQTGDGNHPIHYASQQGDVELLRLCAAQNISLDLRGALGKQPVHCAALNDQKQALQTLSVLRGGYTEAPLTIETQNDMSESARTARVALEGATPLHLASQYSSTETVEWLLAQGANPEAKTQQDQDVLSFAAQNDAAQSILPLFDSYKISQNPESLLQAIVSATSSDNVDAMVALFRKGVSVNAEIDNGSTSLHFACRFGAVQCTSWLLQNGANPLLENSSKQTAFEISAKSSSYDQFHCLLEHTQRDPDWAYGHEQTLLHITAQNGNLKHILLLLMLGASMDATDSSGFTPLHAAAKGGQVAATQLLLGCGGNIYALSSNGRLPRDCVTEDSQKVLQVFADYEKALMPLEESESLLHLAVRMRNPLALLFLLHVIELDQPNSAGQTPLHLAVLMGQTDTVLRLLRAGANALAEDNQDFTCVDLVKQAPPGAQEKLLKIFNPIIMRNL